MQRNRIALVMVGAFALGFAAIHIFTEPTPRSDNRGLDDASVETAKLPVMHVGAMQQASHDLTCQVFDDQRRPIAGASVHAAPEMFSLSSEESLARTDSSGVARVSASHGTRVWIRHPDFCDRLVEFGNTNAQFVRLKSCSGLAFRVVDEADFPIAGAVVIAKARLLAKSRISRLETGVMEEQVRLAGVTDEDGLVRIQGTLLADEVIHAIDFRGKRTGKSDVGALREVGRLQCRPTQSTTVRLASDESIDTRPGVAEWIVSYQGLQLARWRDVAAVDIPMPPWPGFHPMVQAISPGQCPVSRYLEMYDAGHTVVLQTSEIASVRVRVIAGNHRMSGAIVSIQASSGTPVHPDAMFRTGPDGSVSVPLCGWGDPFGNWDPHKNGHWWVTARVHGWATTSVRIGPRVDHGDEVTVDLAPSRTITIKVRDQDGQPTEGAHVVVAESSGIVNPETLSQTWHTTDRAGSVTLTELKEGIAYRVAAAHSIHGIALGDLAPKDAMLNIKLSGSRPVSVRVSPDLVPVRLTAVPDVGMHGSVLRAALESSVSPTVAVEGEWTWNHVPKWPLTVFVSAEGMIPKELALSRIADELNVSLRPSAVIRGSVKPMSPAYIGAIMAANRLCQDDCDAGPDEVTSGTRVLWSSVDEEGNFAIDGAMPNANYELRISRTGDGTRASAPSVRVRAPGRATYAVPAWDLVSVGFDFRNLAGKDRVAQFATIRVLSLEGRTRGEGFTLNATVSRSGLTKVMLPRAQLWLKVEIVGMFSFVRVMRLEDNEQVIPVEMGRHRSKVTVLAGDGTPAYGARIILRGTPSFDLGDGLDPRPRGQSTTAIRHEGTASLSMPPYGPWVMRVTYRGETKDLRGHGRGRKEYVLRFDTVPEKDD